MKKTLGAIVGGIAIAGALRLSQMKPYVSDVQERYQETVHVIGGIRKPVDLRDFTVTYIDPHGEAIPSYFQIIDQPAVIHISDMNKDGVPEPYLVQITGNIEGEPVRQSERASKLQKTLAGDQQLVIDLTTTIEKIVETSQQ